jgi:hypothetical protein
VRWPENVPDVWLPPYGPALNPRERVWRDLQDELAWLQCTDLDAQQAYGGEVLPADDAPPPSAHWGCVLARGHKCTMFIAKSYQAFGGEPMALLVTELFVVLALFADGGGDYGEPPIVEGGTVILADGVAISVVSP